MDAFRPREPYRFADPQQRPIYEGLSRHVGPAAASLYVDACRLMDAQPPFLATSHLVAHCCREIESAVRAILKPTFAPLTGDAVEGTVVAATDGEQGTEPGNNMGHAVQVHAALAALVIPNNDPAAVAWLALVGDLHRRAHRDTLDAPRPVNEDFRVFWQRVQDMLAAILPRIETRFTASLRVLDVLLAKPQPGHKDAKRLRADVPSNLVTLRYFFDRNNNPRWLVPLKNEGFFTDPPLAQQDDTGATWFPPWPAGGYLIRMAARGEESVTQQVLEIILAVSETDNAWVHVDLADTASALPPTLAAQWAVKEIAWVERQDNLSLLIPDQLGKLVLHLASGDEHTVALALARALFAVLPPTASETTDADDSAGWVRREGQLRIDTQRYLHLFKEIIPPLGAVLPEQTFAILCDLLEDAIRFSLPSAAANGARDSSYVWRPAIENHAQNYGYGLRDVLVVAIRDAAEGLVLREPPALPGIVATLEARPWNVFRRIALHLLRRFPYNASTLIVDRLVNRGLLVELDVHHEWVLLLREHFAALSQENQETLLAWIQEEAERDVLVRDDESSGMTDSDSQRQQFRDSRLVRRLALIQEVLPPQWKDRYEAMIARVGEPEHPDFLSYSHSWVGPNSPIAAVELEAMDVTETVAYLQAWRSTGYPGEPSAEGLGRSLTLVVVETPEQFSEAAEQFIGVEPIYVQALLRGLEQGIQKGRELAWEPVLSLCRWAIQQDPGATGGEEDATAEYDLVWRWVHGQVALLLEVGLGTADEGSVIPFALREQVWDVLSLLTEDADPTPAYETQSTMDDVSLALNSTRGKAILAVIQYAIWVRQHWEMTDGNQSTTRGLAIMPEVRVMLDQHLLPEVDPSTAIRAIYGQHFPWLVWLDAPWAETRVAKIFPTSAPQGRLHAAAWEAYLTYCEPQSTTFPLLHAQYAYAIAQFESEPQTAAALSTVTEHLVTHLVLLYGRGVLDLDDPDGLLARFYLTAPDVARGRVIEEAGRRFSVPDDAVDSEVIERFIRLWERRLAEVQQSPDNPAHAHEMAAFSWWFISGKFDNAWAMTQLMAALTLNPRVDMAGSVIRQLATHASSFPLQTVECLALMMEGDVSVYAWSSRHTRAVLVAVIACLDDEAKQVARDLINRLCARGAFEFQDLLE